MHPPMLGNSPNDRETFAQLDLTHVQPLACLKHLSAGVSKSPAELLPVRPVVDFNMVDPRFVAESDALSELDQRPNLMELKPTEFEALIQNLFVKMGLEARQTRPSRDGGVDCVAWDPRPILAAKSSSKRNGTRTRSAYLLCGTCLEPCRTRVQAKESW